MSEVTSEAVPPSRVTTTDALTNQSASRGSECAGKRIEEPQSQSHLNTFIGFRVAQAGNIHEAEVGEVQPPLVDLVRKINMGNVLCTFFVCACV